MPEEHVVAHEERGRAKRTACDGRICVLLHDGFVGIVFSEALDFGDVEAFGLTHGLYRCVIAGV